MASVTAPSTEQIAAIYQQIREQQSSLESVSGCAPNELYHIEGLYLPTLCYTGFAAARELFKARSTDIILATTPKSGTTWLSALIFTIANRNPNTSNNVHGCTTDQLLRKHSPHELITFIEFWAANFDEKTLSAKLLDSDKLPPAEPRFLATHIPFGDLLPKSIVESDCRIIYLCRNPKDTFVSLWHFSQNLGGKSIPLETAFDYFCNGVSFFGPFWDHVLGYWKASLARPDKVLFIKYEELMEDTIAVAVRVSNFIGLPFTEDEERDGVIEGIVKLCGFESMRGFELNKSGKLFGLFDNKHFFRKGKVGDWVNHLTPEMARRLDEITENKFAGTGLAL